MDIYKDEKGEDVIHHKFGSEINHTSEELRKKYGMPNQSNPSTLNSMSTKEIVDYLCKRSGVELIVVLPFEDYEVDTARRQVQEEGPVRILIISE